MADDIKCLELTPEFLQMQDGNHKQKAVVVAAVHCGRYWIQVQFLPKLEAAAFEWDLIGINLCAKAAVTREPLQGIGQPLCG